MKDWTHEVAAKAMKISRQSFIKLERGERKLNEDTIQKACEAFAVTADVVLGKQTPIPVMGRIGAGGSIEPDYEQVPPDGLFTVDLPFAVPAGIDGFQVAGESMLPVYKPGDVILVWREQQRATSDFIGQEAAVLTDTGYRAIKEIQRGRSPNLYNLASYNAKLIQDVKIGWVGEIYIIVPARQIVSAHRSKAASVARKANQRRLETKGMRELPLKVTKKPLHPNS